MHFASEENSVVLLLDNGSLRAESTLQLRRIAQSLANKIDRHVQPVSVLHSDRVPARALGGTAAEVFEKAVRERVSQGVRRFVVVPLFFGPSKAFGEFLPSKMREISEEYPELEVRVAAPLVDPRNDADQRVAMILADHVRSIRAGNGTGCDRGPVVVVDHGSPVKGVTQVRDHVALQLGSIFRDDGIEVVAASMERRQEPEYDFNEPLLRDLLKRLARKNPRTQVTIAMMFLSPGRHAGPDGDVAQICGDVESLVSGFQTLRTRLVGEHPLLTEILADRYHAVSTA